MKTFTMDDVGSEEPCALHALDVQLAHLSSLDRMRYAVGTLLDMLPQGRTYALCKECEKKIASMRGGGQFVVVS